MISVWKGPEEASAWVKMGPTLPWSQDDLHKGSAGKQLSEQDIHSSQDPVAQLQAMGRRHGGTPEAGGQLTGKHVKNHKGTLITK